MILAVPVGTRERILEMEDFEWEMTYDKAARDLGIEPFGSKHWRHSDWVGGARSTPAFYRALTGQWEQELSWWSWHLLWDQVEGHDPYRLALIGGNTLVISYDHNGHRDESRRLSTTEEAAEALHIMEKIGARLDSGEETLQPFARDIRAYLDFYRSLRIGEEELIYGHTS